MLRELRCPAEACRHSFTVHVDQAPTQLPCPRCGQLAAPALIVAIEAAGERPANGEPTEVLTVAAEPEASEVRDVSAVTVDRVPDPAATRAYDPADEPARQAAILTRRLAEALAYAHGKGIIHRDVKPANVLLAEPDVPLLTDFGLWRPARPMTRS